MEKLGVFGRQNWVCGHDDGVFTVVGVVAFPDAPLGEAILTVQGLGDVVGYADFQGDSGGATGHRMLYRRDEEELAYPSAPVLAPHAHGYDVRFVRHVPGSQKSGDEFLRLLGTLTP